MTNTGKAETGSVMKSAMSPYKIGLCVLMVLVIGLAGFVILQAEKTKQDTATNRAASKIADQLNSYVEANNAIPDSLGEAHITNVPSAIRYQKLSEASYTFCVTYKTGSSGLSGVDTIVNTVTSGSLTVGSSTSVDNYQLYIDGSYHKGVNCQKVTPYLVSGISGGGGVFQPLTTTTPTQSATTAGTGSSVCGSTGFTTHYSGKITAIIPIDQSTADANANQAYVIDVQPNGDTPKGVQKLTVGVNYNTYDSYCTAINAASLQTGDEIAVFLNNSDPGMPNSIKDFSF